MDNRSLESRSGDITPEMTKPLADHYVDLIDPELHHHSHDQQLLPEILTVRTHIMPIEYSKPRMYRIKMLQTTL